MAIWKDIIGRLSKNDRRRYNTTALAKDWDAGFQPYVPYGKSRAEVMENVKFPAGAISRGTGIVPTTIPVADRHFNWNKYQEMLADTRNPKMATEAAMPRKVLDWNDIEYDPAWGYHPKMVDTGKYSFAGAPIPKGPISRAADTNPIVDYDGNPYSILDFATIKDDIDLSAKLEEAILDVLNNVISIKGAPMGNIKQLDELAPRRDIVRQLMRMHWLPENEW